jgi:hypothetical protein
MPAQEIAAPIRIAYIISAYKLPEQLARLIRTLQNKASSFFVHVDKKADASVFNCLAAELENFSNVYFVKRHTCDWGGFGHVEATLESMHTLLRLGTPFDYVVLLTGQDYPIKPPSYIASFLASQDGRCFVDYFPLPHADWQNGGLDRVQFWHVRVRNNHLRIPPASIPLPRRRPPRGMKLFGGSSYWCLTRECTEYINAYIGGHPEFVRFFSYVDVPDELFFQTLMLNSPLRDAIINDDLRYIRWTEPDYGSPAILTEADFADLVTSPKLFARKFDVTVDPNVLDMIDVQLLGAQ